MPSPTVSIIIPTHERPQYLRAAIYSIVQQTYKDWEIIVVDDGSEGDPYRELKEETAEQPIVWHKQKQSGPGVARATGLAWARGDYIAFLDDDDYYLPDHFSRLIEATKWTDRKIIRSGLIGRKKDGSLVKYKLYTNRWPTLEQYWETPSNLTTLLFTREAARRVPIDTMRTTIEDFTWLVRVFAHYDLYQIDNYSAVYVLHDSNRNNLASASNFLNDRILAMENAYRYPTVSDRVGYKAKNNWVTHQYLHFSRNCMRSGNWELAITGIRGCLPYASGNNIKEFIYTAYFAVKTTIVNLLGKIK